MTEILRAEAAERVIFLENRDLIGWASCLEQEIEGGKLPEVSLDEGRNLANLFLEEDFDLKEITPTEPEGTTETPVMKAITRDLEAVFGETITADVDGLVTKKIMPLEGKGDRERPNRFRVIAVKNVLRNLMAVARVFQLSDQELAGLYPKTPPALMREAALNNLSFDSFVRMKKGEPRARGLLSADPHREHIWNLRGVRDLPGGSLSVIGEFLQEKIGAREKIDTQ